MSFFDTSSDTRQEAYGQLNRAMSFFGSPQMQGDIDFYRSQFEPLINRIAQMQTLAGTMGARSAQAGMRRLVGPGSGVGEVGIGFQLGAGFGPAQQLAADAMRDAIGYATGMAGSRSAIAQQKANVALATPGKSGWDTFREAADVAGSLASAFGGNPYTPTAPQGTGPGGIPLQSAMNPPNPYQYSPGYGPLMMGG